MTLGSLDGATVALCVTDWRRVLVLSLDCAQTAQPAAASATAAAAETSSHRVHAGVEERSIIATCVNHFKLSASICCRRELLMHALSARPARRAAAVGP